MTYPHAYRYEMPLETDEVLVALRDSKGYFPSLADDIREAAARTRFTFLDLDAPASALRTDGYLLKHAIVVDGDDDPHAAMTRNRDLLEAFDTMTLAMSYSSPQAFVAAGPVVDDLKLRFGSRVNFLRPNRLGSFYRPSLLKLVDNAICDSVRVKYVSARESVDACLGAEVEFFRAMSRLVGEQRLYHRAPTDGYIACRALDGDGFFVTATKTNKVTLDIHRISRVHGYSRGSNVLRYSGRFLPSSDSVEAAVMFAAMPELTGVLHSHASAAFTRNLSYASRVVSPVCSYGVPEAADAALSFIEFSGYSDFVIMEDHGELFLTRAGSVRDRASEIASVITTEVNRSQAHHV